MVEDLIGGELGRLRGYSFDQTVLCTLSRALREALHM